MSATEQGTSHYELLDVSSDASTEDIKKAYRKLAKRLHPDVAGPGMESLFAQVTRAFEVLSDPDRRAQYDASRTSDPIPESDPEPEPWGTDEVVFDESLAVDDDPLPPPPPPPVPPTPALSAQAASRARALKVLAWLSIPALLTYVVAAPFVMVALTGEFAYNLQMEVGAWMPLVVPLMVLRVFRKRGKVSLGLMIGLGALLLIAGQFLAVGAVLLSVATAELWRRKLQSGHRRRLANDWHLFHAWADGRELLVLSVAPQGQRSLALVQNPYTLERHQIMVWGGARPGTWIVLDSARAVLGSCADEARKAWESLYI